MDRSEDARGPGDRLSDPRQSIGSTDFEIFDREAGLFEISATSRGLAKDRCRLSGQRGGDPPQHAGEGRSDPTLLRREVSVATTMPARPLRALS